MGNSTCAKRHFDVLGDFAFSFFKNYTVKCLDNKDSDSQGHSVYISIERNELTYEGTLFISVGKWETVHVLRHIWMLWVILLLVFFKYYTVKCLDREYSDSQGHSKYISIDRMR